MYLNTYKYLNLLRKLYKRNKSNLNVCKSCVNLNNGPLPNLSTIIPIYIYIYMYMVITKKHISTIRYI